MQCGSRKNSTFVARFSKRAATWILVLRDGTVVFIFLVPRIILTFSIEARKVAFANKVGTRHFSCEAIIEQIQLLYRAWTSRRNARMRVLTRNDSLFSRKGDAHPIWLKVWDPTESCQQDHCFAYADHLKKGISKQTLSPSISKLFEHLLIPILLISSGIEPLIMLSFKYKEPVADVA